MMNYRIMSWQERRRKRSLPSVT